MRENYDNLANFLAAFLMAVPPHARGSVLSAARNRASGERCSIPAIWDAVPSDASITVAVNIVRGFAAQLLALLGVADAQATSVADVLSTADAMAAGVPMGGDPADHPHYPVLASVMLDAVAKSDSAIPQEVEATLIELAEHYDCAYHELPLGGGLFSSIGDWFKGMFGNAEQRAAYQQRKASAAQKRSDDLQVQALMNQGLPYDDAVALVYGRQSNAAKDAGESSDAQGVEYDWTEMIPAGAESAKSKLDSFKSALEQAQKQMDEQKKEAQSAADELARFTWAEQILNAPVEVIRVLQEVNPQFGSVGGSLETAFDVIAAAKETGDARTTGLVQRMLRTLKGKNVSYADSIASMLGFDPTIALAPVETSRDPADDLASYLKAKSILQSPGMTSRLGKEVEI